MKKILIAFVIVIIFIGVLIASLLIYINMKAGQDTKVKSDVILVLGGHVISGTSCVGPVCKTKGFVIKPHYNPCVVARVDHAVALYKDHYASKILMSGGTDEENNANEAETMKKMALQAGIPPEAILVEKKSTSTYENFKLSKEILDKADLHSVIVVTEPYHIARAGLVASKLKYTYTLSPAVESVCWNQNNFFANWNFVKKEVPAIIGYKILNKI